LPLIHISLSWIVVLIISLVIGVIVGYFFRKKWFEKRIADAENIASKIISEAEKKAEILKREALLQAKDKLYQSKAEFEKETAERRAELQKLEKRLLLREENIDKKVNMLDNKEIELNQKEKNLLLKEKEINDKEKKYNELLEIEKARLEKIANLTKEEAKKMLMESIESEVKHEMAKKIKEMEDEARETADKKAKDIISLAIQRYAGDYVPTKQYLLLLFLMMR